MHAKTASSFKMSVVGDTTESLVSKRRVKCFIDRLLMCLVELRNLYQFETELVTPNTKIHHCC